MKLKSIAQMLAVLLLLFVAAGCAAAQSPEGATEATPAADSLSADEELIGKYASGLKSVASQDFTLMDLNGKQWTLSELKGKVVLLNFWATWCGPCQMEMPGFQKLYERFGDTGDVIVLAVAGTALEGLGEQASREAVEAFVVEQGFTFPVLFDTDGAVWSVYQQEGIPANYIIDWQGDIRLLVAGAFRNDETMHAALEAVRRADSGK